MPSSLPRRRRPFTCFAQTSATSVALPISVCNRSCLSTGTGTPTSKLSRKLRHNLLPLRTSSNASLSNALELSNLPTWILQTLMVMATFCSIRDSNCLLRGPPNQPTPRIAGTQRLSPAGCLSNRDREQPFGCPLPHHLTCGSASGGSSKRSKVSPQVSEKHKSLFSEPLLCHAAVTTQRFG